jgi:hypothetical protein
MSRIAFITAAALIAVSVVAQAAPGPTVNLDGSVNTHKKPTLATTANRQLRANDVPSARPAPVDLKAQADADIAKRNKAAKAPRLTAERQNLKGDDAARAIAQQHNPSTYDRDISMGDKDHTEQVTNLKVYLKK